MALSNTYSVFFSLRGREKENLLSLPSDSRKKTEVGLLLLIMAYLGIPSSSKPTNTQL